MKNLPEYIGPYKILEKLGEGGFSTVYLAHAKHLDKTHSVALKVLNSRENYGRFRREIETVAKLNHPNIIHIFDTGEDEETQVPFYSMEYIPSGTLCDKLATEYRLSRNEAIDIIRRIGPALTYPHKQGIIHRDVNPKNILLDTRQQPTRPVLTDFGMVKPLAPEDSKLTKTIALIGTFAYYAPEQWNQEELAPATDVYALGITFFEMLSGQRPFKGDVFSLREKHLHEPLPPLSSIVPEIGSFFDDVLIKATAKNPADRYQSVASFIEAIEAADEKAEEAAKLARRKRAIEAIEIAQDSMQQRSYPAAEILEIINTALEDYPGYGNALRLRGKIKLDQQQYWEALEDFKQAYEQTQDPSSEAGADYACALKQAADFFWQNQAYQEAVGLCKTVKQILNENYDEETSLHVWQEVWSDLVKSHYDAGVETYATSDLENIAQTIEFLEREIEALEALEAHSEARAFREKLRVLQIRVYHNTGIEAYAEGNPDDNQEAITVLLRQIEALEALEAHTESQELQNKLGVLQIKEHYNAGVEAYATSDPENIIQTIEVLGRKIEVLEVLEAYSESQDLQDKMRDLQVKNHYNSGIQVYAEGNPADTAKAIAALESEIQALQALNAGRECQDLYSKLTLLQIREHYEAGVEAYTNSDLEDIAQTIELLERKIEELEALEAHTESQDLQDKLRVLQIKLHYNAGIEAYAERNIEDITKVIEVLEREAQSLQTLKANREYQELEEKLRLLQAKRAKEISYNEIQKLVERGEYSEALTRLDKEFIQVGDYEYEDVARLFWGLIYANQHEGEFPSEWAIPVSHQQKLERRHNINKYTIPISLAIAVILGGVIAPQIDNLPGLPIIMFISLILLAVYFAYYIWVYYIDV